MYQANRWRWIFIISSLSDHGKLRASNTSDLVDCLEDLDGAEVVHQLDPRTARTVSDYADTVVQPYTDRQLQVHEAQRADLVWNVYIPDSLE